MAARNNRESTHEPDSKISNSHHGHNNSSNSHHGNSNSNNSAPSHHNPNNPSNNSGNPRSSNKTKQAALKLAQEQYIAQHTHSNGPQDQDPVDPLDFETLPVEVLNKYRKKHGLEVAEGMTAYGEMLDCSVGNKTFTGRNGHRVTKPQLAAAAKKHFLAQTVKESDVIASFIYSINNENKTFKLTF